MRDLRNTDQVVKNKNGSYTIIDEHGCHIPVVWKDLKDFARWWFRQQEINDQVTLLPEVKSVLMRILNDEPVIEGEQ